MPGEVDEWARLTVNAMIAAVELNGGLGCMICERVSDGAWVPVICIAAPCPPDDPRAHHITGLDGHEQSVRLLPVGEILEAEVAVRSYRLPAPDEDGFLPAYGEPGNEA